ncbi:uncharacterized protein N7477_006739 [Penicillium maclennaniae]|uniref:uncharacterized protein n=1 Tax=Penicillium maclennaniae TaxID=1343394 RepID=UPI002540383A|nr:uncharacterized protein N7477_006739 [Penicillium maclennaniae]KAJ5668169.1 hypothetical protein N7477_006739 [Penicillium maclennaniae]
MTDHALISRAEIADQAVAVRATLKVWEKEFASTHGGRKAGRDDIKQNPEIAAKYKEYTRLKNLEASLARRENRRHEHPESHSKKRKYASPTGPTGSQIENTPRKSFKGLFATPSNNRTKEIHPSQLDPYDSPSTFRRLFSPSTHRQSLPAPSPLKAAIGPTPQRDGKTLGLFDMLSESGGSHATPSAKKQKDMLGAGFQTPSKRKTFEPITEVPDEEEESSRLSRTPASSTKQFYLANLFATPTTMRYAAMVEAEDEKAEQRNSSEPAATAASPEPNPSETPSFLRRSNFNRLPPSTHNNAGLSPIASRKPVQYAGRGLSHIVQEIEAEHEAVDMAPEDHFPEQKGKPYKKKGQKRTTRRVIMRPVAPRPKPKPEAAPPIDSDDELAAVPETQLVDAKGEEPELEIPNDVAFLHSIEAESNYGTEPDLDSDDDPEFNERPKPLTKAKSFSERIKEAVGLMPKTQKVPVKAPEPEIEDKEKKTKPPKKVNPQAHANYRSLKIHRGRGRGGGRFRRR